MSDEVEAWQAPEIPRLRKWSYREASTRMKMDVPSVLFRVAEFVRDIATEAGAGEDQRQEARDVMWPLVETLHWMNEVRARDDIATLREFGDLACLLGGGVVDDAVATLTAERDAATAERDALRAEADALKAELARERKRRTDDLDVMHSRLVAAYAEPPDSD